MAKQLKQENEVTYKEEWVSIDDPRLNFSPTRPIDEKHVESTAARMRAQGYDANHPIPCYVSAGKLVNYGGSHRHEGAKKAGLTQILVKVRSVPAANNAERLALAIQDNYHLENGENKGKMAFALLREMRTAKEPLPKTSTLSQMLGAASDVYCEQILRAYKLSSEATINRFIDDPKFTWGKLRKFLEAYPAKEVQAAKVAKNEITVEARYKPIISGDNAKTLATIAPLFGEHSSRVLGWLTGTDPAAAEAARDYLISSFAAGTVATEPTDDQSATA